MLHTLAPAFTLKDQHNQQVSLADFRGRKAVLLVFYPLAFSGTCQGELAGIQDDLGSYANDNVQVVTVSVDSTWAHRVWADREGFDFPLLSDFWPHGAVAQAYGVFNADAGFANRGTYLIDRSGVIRYAAVVGPGSSRGAETWREALAALG
jgi:peroxiredoxin